MILKISRLALQKTIRSQRPNTQTLDGGILLNLTGLSVMSINQVMVIKLGMITMLMPSMVAKTKWNLATVY